MSPFSRKELGIHSTLGKSTWSRRSSTPIGGSLGLEIKLREGLSPRVWGERVRAWGRESWREREWYGLVSERERGLKCWWGLGHKITPGVSGNKPWVSGFTPGSSGFTMIPRDKLRLSRLDLFWKFVQTSKLSHLAPPTIFLAKHSSFPVPTF